MVVNGYASEYFRVQPPSNTGNPGGYLRDVLPNLAQNYLAARARQAEELGLDPASFNLCDWLLGQEEAAQRVEREAEEGQARQEQECGDTAQAEADSRQQARTQDHQDAERAHREEYPDHYEACGHCRRCRSGAPCFSLVHRGDGDPWCGESLSYETEAA